MMHINRSILAPFGRLKASSNHLRQIFKASPSLLSRNVGHNMPFSMGGTSLYGYGMSNEHSWLNTPRHATTILCVRKDNTITIIGDGQVSQGNVIVKPNAKKVRRISSNVIAGFAGTTADCLALTERLESKLEKHPGQLMRACVELAKEWRMDRVMRHLEAVMIVCDSENIFEVTGNGDVLESQDGVMAIGSGGNYALAAARALHDIPGLSSEDIAKRSMKVAADMCTHTNHNWVIETINVADK